MSQTTYAPAEIAAYYNTYTDVYLKETGEFIQAFRPQNTDKLMRSIVKAANLQPRMHVLDAGCGVGAPAIWLAKHFRRMRITALTVSERQAELATERVRRAKLQDRIEIVLGDYHRLPALFAPAQFDAALFLESLGHSHDLSAVMGGVGTVLKPGGTLYLKDFFRRRAADPARQEAIDNVIRIINEAYCYGTMDLAALLAALQTHGFGNLQMHPPAIAADINVTIRFEEATGRRTYPYYAAVDAAEWYEIRATLHQTAARP